MTYADGSGITVYGSPVTRFRYIVTNTVRDGEVRAGTLDASDLPAGDYVLRVVVRDLAGNSRAQAMVVAVVQLTRATQLKLTAECIATEAILSAALRLGVDYGQGFRYRPATAARSGPARTVAHAPARLARARRIPDLIVRELPQL